MKHKPLFLGSLFCCHPRADMPSPLHSPPSQLVAPDSVESKFRALEGSDVDDELAKMRAQLGSGKVKGEVSWNDCNASLSSHASWSIPFVRLPRNWSISFMQLPRSCCTTLGACTTSLANLLCPLAPLPLLQLPPGRPLNDALDYELQDMKKKMNGGQ